MAALLSNTIGYAIFISLFVIIYGLYGAKAWLHRKCKQLLIEHSQNTNDKNGHNSLESPMMADADTDIHHHIQHPPKDQTYFTQQIFPKSTLQLQIYLSSIDHFIEAIRTPMVQIAITILLYTLINSELVTNYNNSNYVYNIIFHSFQLIALISFYIVSNMDPGIIKAHPAPTTTSNNNNNKYDEIKDLPSSSVSPQSHNTKLTLQSNDETQQLLSSSDENAYRAMIDNQNGIKGNHNPPKGILFQPRYKYMMEPDETELERLTESHCVEIECEWNNDSTIPISYCYNCYFLHPLRAKHCYEIGFCVARYDHYCKLIENAVGANNLRFVIFHLLLDSVIHVWELCMIVYIVILNIDSSSKDIIGWILIVFICGFLLISSLTRTIHLFDHIQTISKNQTISEKVDPQRTIDVLNDGYHDYDEDDREIDYHDRYFDEGFFKNWVLCFTAYKENKEYFNGIKCKLMFDEDDGDDGTIFLQ